MPLDVCSVIIDVLFKKKMRLKNLKDLSYTLIFLPLLSSRQALQSTGNRNDSKTFCHKINVKRKFIISMKSCVAFIDDKVRKK